MNIVYIIIFFIIGFLCGYFTSVYVSIYAFIKSLKKHKSSNVTLYINNDIFICDCGNNKFSIINNYQYKCTKCGNIYEES